MHRCENGTVLHIDIPVGLPTQQCDVKWTMGADMTMADFPNKEARRWLDDVRRQMIRYRGQLEVNRRIPA
jgi:hypothetical protein